MSYENFIFSIDNNGKKRTYSCDRLSPKVACEFGMEIYCDICSILNSESQKNYGDDNFDPFSFIVGIFSKIDAKLLMDRFKYILKNTKIVAVEEGSQQEFFIGNDGHYNEWFAKYPQDTFLVLKNVIWENAAPFLPPQITELTEKMKGIGSEITNSLHSANQKR